MWNEIATTKNCCVKSYHSIVYQYTLSAWLSRKKKCGLNIKKQKNIKFDLCFAYVVSFKKEKWNEKENGSTRKNNPTHLTSKNPWHLWEKTEWNNFPQREQQFSFSQAKEQLIKLIKIFRLILPSLSPTISRLKGAASVLNIFSNTFLCFQQHHTRQITSHEEVFKKRTVNWRRSNGKTKHFFNNKRKKYSTKSIQNVNVRYVNFK